MKKLSKEKRDQLLLVVLGTAGLVVGLWMGVIQGQKAKLESYHKDLTQLEDKLLSATRRIENKDENARELEIVRQKLDAIENGMAQGDLYAWMIMTINNFKERYPVEIPQISRESLNEVKILPKFAYDTATFRVHGTAYYHDLGRFIADFENEYPFMRIHNLQLRAAKPGKDRTLPDSDGATEKLRFQMEIVTLVKSQPTT